MIRCQPLLEPKPGPGDDVMVSEQHGPDDNGIAKRAAAEARRSRVWWEQQWSRFPTVGCRADGAPCFWQVPPDSGCYQDDWPLGERLARETVAQMRRFSEGSSVLRRILRELDYNSTVGQGFLSALEEILVQRDGAQAQRAETQDG